MKKIILIILIAFITFPLFSYTYDELVSAMEINNTKIQSSIKDFHNAGLDVKDAEAAYHPQIEAQLSSSYIINPMEPITISSSQFVPGTNQYIEVFPGQESMYYKGAISLQQPIFTWLKISNAVDLYQNLEQIAAININDITKQSKTELQTRLTTMIYLDKIIALLKKQKELSNELLTITKNSYSQGVLTELDLKKTELETGQVDLVLSEIKAQKDVNMVQISLSTGLENLESKDIDYEVDEDLFTYIAEYDRNELLNSAISGSRDSIRMLNLANSVLEERKSIAKSSMYGIPDLALVVDLNYSGSRIPFVEINYQKTNNFGGSITVALQTTLWDGGIKLNELKRSDNELEINAIDRTDAINTIKATLTDQLSVLDTALSKIEYYELNREYLKTEKELEENKLALGSSNKTVVLSLEIENITNELNILTEKINIAAACYLIYYLSF